MNIDTLVESFYNKEDETETLISEVLKLLLTEQDVGMPARARFDWSMIPDIPISEIGWSDVSTIEKDGKTQTILGPQRALLQQYLDNIGSPDGGFAEQIASLESFYTDGPDQIVGSSENNTELISKLISYLVFYKTLTKIVTNFNAASAGFNFESFLATLLHGEQIKANTGTIADFLTGDNIPISLKLYAEKTLHVEGSFTDLVNDLSEPQFSHPAGNAMRYVVCTKSIEGEGLEQFGTITFYQFDFTLDNLYAILSTSKDKSRKCLYLPRSFVDSMRAGEPIDFAGSLPAKENLPSPEELEKVFIANAVKRFRALDPESPLRPTQKEFQDLLQTIDYAKSDDYFKAVPRGDVNVVVRGLSTMPKTGLYNLIKSVYQENHPKLKANAFKAISGIFHDANEEIVNTLKASELKKQRKSTLDATDFVTDMDELVTFYAELSDEQKKLALKNSLGYMDTFQFSLNRSQSTDPEPPIATENLGVITIGGKEVEKMLTRIASILDKEIFAVFTSLKTLSDSLNGFFAGGLADDGKALEAIGSAQEIEKKTTELKGEK
jgi:hypothetical protein